MNLVSIGLVISEEKSFEIYDGWTTEPTYPIRYPGAFDSSELKSTNHDKDKQKLIKKNKRTTLKFLILFSSVNSILSLSV